MNIKVLSSLALGFSLSVIPPAMAQNRSHENDRSRRQDQHSRQENRHEDSSRRPPSSRPDASTENYYQRHGQWRHGQVEQRNGRFRFAPKTRFRARSNVRHFGRILGIWEDLLRKSTGSGDRVYQIGSTRLDNDQDYDVIDVSDTNNCVKKVRIRVEGADALIDRIALRYVDGSDQELDVNGYFAEGSGDTSWRDIPGWSKCIDSIVVIGQTQRSRNRRNDATVEIWGLK